MNKIYCWINNYQPNWYTVCAIAEDGEALASHISSNESFAKHDIGITSDWKHDIYNEKYPEGWELEWINRDELDTHIEFNKAIELNQKMY